MLKLAANYERIADEADELNGREFLDESGPANVPP
jgi:hypothetical protein